nr:hypothetical protein [Tanacetum cinerariifolium]
NVAGTGPTWLFDIDSLSWTMNYHPVFVENQPNSSAGFQDTFDAEKAGEVSMSAVIHSSSISAQTRKQADKTERENKGKTPVESFTGFRDLNAEFEECSNNISKGVNAASSTVPTVGHNFINSTNIFSAVGPSNTAELTYSDDEDVVGVETDINNLESSIPVSPIPTTRIHKDHPISQNIGDLSSTTQTRSMAKAVKDQVDLRYGKRAIGTKWVYRNKKDERGIVIRNKARLVAQGHTQEDGINYEEVFAPIARVKAIRLFLDYASFMGILVYQMDVKSAFLYGTIEEEVYVCQPPGFEDPDHPNKVYKVVKALYGLHQAPRAWYETLATYLLENDDIIFGATYKDLCKSFEKLMKDRLQMSSMGELTFFLGLQKSASTPIETEKPLLKDLDGEDVDVHTYRYMIAYSDSDYAGASLDRKSTTGGCQFLGYRLISWQCKKQTVVATSSTEAEYIAATGGIESSDDTIMEDVINQGRMIDELDRDEGIELMGEKEEKKKDIANDDQAEWRHTEIQAEKQDKIYQLDMDHAAKVLSIHEEESTEVQEVVEVVTTAKLITDVVNVASASVSGASTLILAVEPNIPAVTITVAPVKVAAASTRRRRGVVIRDLEEESTAITHAETKDKGKELNQDIDWDVAIEHVKKKAKEDPFIQRYQVIKKKPQREAQARRNMITYLKNTAGLRLDYFKGMSYDDIRPIFEAKFNENMEFLLKSKEKIEEEANSALQRQHRHLVLPEVNSSGNQHHVVKLGLEIVVVVEGMVRGMWMEYLVVVVLKWVEQIFTGLARMGYEKPSTKLTSCKAFFSSQWKFLIHTILQSLSAKRTSWNEFSSAMASAVICLSTCRKFNFSKYIFDSLVRNVDSSSKFYMYPMFIQLIIQNQLGDLSTHTTKYISPALT